MDFQTRMEKLLKATPEILAKVDAILEGKDMSRESTRHT